MCVDILHGIVTNEIPEFQIIIQDVETGNDQCGSTCLENRVIQ